MGSRSSQRRMKPSSSGCADGVVTGEKYLGRFLNCSQSMLRAPLPSLVTTRLVTPFGAYSKAAVCVSH